MTDYRKDRADTHSAESCYHKRKAEGESKESNQMEGIEERMMNRMEEMFKMTVKNMKKKSREDDNSD